MKRNRWTVCIVIINNSTFGSPKASALRYFQSALLTEAKKSFFFYLIDLNQWKRSWYSILETQRLPTRKNTTLKLGSVTLFVHSQKRTHLFFIETAAYLVHSASVATNTKYFNLIKFPGKSQGLSSLRISKIFSS